jgi:putative photosynthetic complex assembly protein
MTMQTTQTRPVEREMIPKPLLWAMFSLAMSSLALASYSVWSGRPHGGVPVQSVVASEMDVILEGHGARAVTVKAPDGRVLADLAHGGFIAVIQNGLERERLVHGVAADRPVRLVRFANGRLSVIDPDTGWSVELRDFGADNRAAFERLMAK